MIWHFFHLFKNLFWWRHNGHFICFPMGHSHGQKMTDSYLTKSESPVAGARYVTTGQLIVMVIVMVTDKPLGGDRGMSQIRAVWRTAVFIDKDSRSCVTVGRYSPQWLFYPCAIEDIRINCRQPHSVSVAFVQKKWLNTSMSPWTILFFKTFPTDNGH